MKNNLKIVFLGNPDFSIPALESLIKEKYQIIGVITSPDKPVGRKKIITPPPLKAFAQKNNLQVYQPIDKTELLKIFKKIKPDLGIVAAFGMILSQDVLDIPQYGLINIHPSLLPCWRGATPIQNTILQGDKKTGTTLYLMDEKIDHGSILIQKELNNYNSEIINYEKLAQNLAKLGAELLIETLPKYINGEIKPRIQDELKAVYTKKFSTDDAFINPDDLIIAQEKGGEKAIEIDRKIRALNPEPGPWTIYQEKNPFNFPLNKRIKLLEAIINSEKRLILKKIQVEGKKPIDYN